MKKKTLDITKSRYSEHVLPVPKLGPSLYRGTRNYLQTKECPSVGDPETEVEYQPPVKSLCSPIGKIYLCICIIF